jgi:multiple sugar transport system substrate-binding protein
VTARGESPRRTYGTRVDRRSFLKTSGAGAAAAGLAGAVGATILAPGRARAAKKTLRILQWVHFVPAYDEWLNKKYVKEWGDKNDTEVIVDSIGIAGINARAAAEVSAQRGHDLFLFNWPPPTCPSTSPSRARTIPRPRSASPSRRHSRPIQ